MAPNLVTTMDQLMGLQLMELQLMGLQLIGLYEQPSDISIAKAIDHIRIAITPAPSSRRRRSSRLPPAVLAASIARRAAMSQVSCVWPTARRSWCPTAAANRIDSLRNIMRDPRASPCRFWSGHRRDHTGRGSRRALDRSGPDRELCGQRQVALLCARDHGRARLLSVHQGDRSLQLWDPARRVDRQSLPTTGAILAAQTAGRLGGDEHDRGQLERTMAKLY
jgi:hypothetical protein